MLTATVASDGSAVACAASGEWWQLPSERQVIDLYWHSARGTVGSEYAVVEYLAGCADGPREHALRTLRGELSRTGMDSGGVTPARAENTGSSAREARLLECRLLVSAMMGGVMSGAMSVAMGKVVDGAADGVINSTMDNLPSAFEDCYEELAVHYSVDVAIPDKFVGWLQKIGGRALEVLEALGISDGSEDGGGVKGEMDLFQWPSPSVASETHLNPAVRKIRQDSQAEDSPSKKRRLSLRRQSGSANFIVDNRFQVEFDQPRLSLPSVPTNAAPKKAPEIAPQETPKKKRRMNEDPTIILETPPKLTPSRPSTPSCSQCINGLSLDD